MKPTAKPVPAFKRKFSLRAKIKQNSGKNLGKPWQFEKSKETNFHSRVEKISEIP
jgi:hypothetical protein